MTDQTQNTASTSSGQAGFTPLPDEQNSNSGGGTPLAQVATATIAIAKADLEKFGIDENFARTNPALVDLILKTESMKDEERKYWFQLLPVMSADQVAKLQNILQNERDQLEELDAKYENEVAKLNSNAPSWDPEKFRQKKIETQKNESAEEIREKDAEADILNQLENS
jgi:hypothetical protein